MIAAMLARAGDDNGDGEDDDDDGEDDNDNREDDGGSFSDDGRARMAKINMTAHAGEDVEQGEHSSTAGEDVEQGEHSSTAGEDVEQGEHSSTAGEDVEQGEHFSTAEIFKRHHSRLLSQWMVQIQSGWIKHLSNEHDGNTDSKQKDISEINLDLNAKGAILNAFEMFRLKSCVDFKPYEGESSYIIFQQFSGCWSMVGDQHGGQNISIGPGCDYKAIIEHEILHALGFYHEQSRTDRDDYVTIWWDEILPDYEHNFNVYDDTFITDLNTPYDYESVMHYDPFSFNKNENIPTITTKIPKFNGIIGQRLDFSTTDLERLNRMYNCTTTHTLLDHCTFEKINICGMIQGTRDDDDWVHEDSSQSGRVDHTLVGQCK
ncbi:hypothetical protein STEG23_035088, partial [Scotinomys teguina]